MQPEILFLGGAAQHPQWIMASLFTRFLDHTQTHHTRSDSSGRVISWKHTTLTTDRQPCPRWDSNS